MENANKYKVPCNIGIGKNNGLGLVVTSHYSYFPLQLHLFPIIGTHTSLIIATYFAQFRRG